MTTLAIIGSGIAGRSFLYSLAKSQKKFDKIIVFYSETFVPPCSFRSTAIVAPRGVSSGVSPLGDVLQEGFRRFHRHVQEDRPQGVIFIKQYTGALTRLDQFKKRYPLGKASTKAGALELQNPVYLAEEDAYLVQPQTYLEWLRKTVSAPVEEISDFVTEVSGKVITTLGGRRFEADKIIFTSGAASQFWKPLFPSSKLESSKPVMGSYLEYRNVLWSVPSFSLTLEGDNLIYDAQSGSLKIGSTTAEGPCELPLVTELRNIHTRLQGQLKSQKLSVFDEKQIVTGTREKASKREPYLVQEGSHFALGGFYKNGYMASLSLAEKLVALL